MKEDDSLVSGQNDAEPNQPLAEVAPEFHYSWLQLHKMHLFLAVAVVFIGGAAFAFILSHDSKTEAPSQTDTQNSQASEQNPNSSVAKLDQIIYAHNDVDRLPRSIFSRPASGGDRTQLNGSIKSTATNLSRDENAYAFFDPSSHTIWYGKDDEPAEKIYDVNHTFEMTRLKLDKKHNSILFSVVQSSDSGLAELETRIVEINTEGSDQKILLTESTDAGALFVEDWNPETDKVLFRRSCWGCDGYNADLYLLDGEKQSKIYDTDDYESPTLSYAALDDLSKIVFVRGKVYSDQEREDYSIVNAGLGSPVGPPYELVELNITTGEEQVLKTYGAIQDISNKSFVPSFSGWVHEGDTQTPYFTYKNQLYLQNASGDFDVVFESDSANIANVYSVDSSEIVVGLEAKDGETITYFNRQTNKASTVMETSFYTLVLALTRKTS